MMNKPKLDTKKIIIGALIITLSALVIMIAYEANIYLKANEKNDSILKAENKLTKIGLTLGTLKEDRWIKDSGLLRAKAAEYGVDLIVLNANNNDNDQIEQVKYLLKQEIDVLMIVPTDYKAAAEAVSLAKAKGVPVISYDRLVQNANVDLYISFDNFKVGQIMAQTVVDEQVQDLLIINGAKSDNNTNMIKQGYDSILKPYIESGEINLIEEYWATNWLKEEAFRYTEETLKSDVKPDAIISGNDSLAEAAFEALSEYRLSGEVILVGQDADLTACQRIVEGTQLMTVYKPIDDLVTIAIEMAIKLANGEKIETKATMNDGIYDIKCLFLEPVAVDKSNIDETIIKDGFHLKSDVYRKQ